MRIASIPRAPARMNCVSLPCPAAKSRSNSSTDLRRRRSFSLTIAQTINAIARKATSHAIPSAMCFRSLLLEPHFRARIFRIVPRVLCEQFLGLLADDPGKGDLHLNELIAANSAGSQTGNTALTQTEALAGLSARRNPEQALSIYGRHLDLCAKRRFGHGYWDYAINIVALAFEIRMLANVGYQVKVTRRTAKAARVA